MTDVGITVEAESLVDVDGGVAENEIDPSDAPRARRRLRVLHLGRVGFIGGAERVMLSLACAGRQEGIDTFLACPEGFLAEEARRQGLSVTVVPFSRMKITPNPLKYIAYFVNRVSSSRRLTSLCRDLQIDVLHVHHPVTALYCDDAVEKLGLPLVLHLHEGLPARPLYKLALRRAARLATKIVCVSNAGRELLRAGGADASKSIVVHNGVRLAPRETSAFAKASDEMRIAVIGLIEPRKGQDILIEAAAMLAPARPRTHFHIIGDSPANGAARYKRRLRELVARLGLHQQIEFMPYAADIVDRMTGYDIVVSSSIGLESLSLVMLEAMSKERVVVSTRLGGITDVIEQGVNGFLAEPGCARSLASSLRDAMACDHAAVGAAARRTIEERFSSEAMRKNMSRIYAQLTPSRMVVR